MRSFADDAEPAANRLALALLLAMGLHLALLVVPLDWRILPFPAPRRFEVALSPPVKQPIIGEPVAAAEIVDLPEPEPSQLDTAPPVPSAAPMPIVEAPPPPPAFTQPPPVRPTIHSAKPSKPVKPSKPIKPLTESVVQQSVKPVAQGADPSPAAAPAPTD